ncbi:MAG TPA: Ku protein [Cyclobacteriaceae bacterium]|nr:Ku protein [Cyclobacteriaceae bacterium]
MRAIWKGAIGFGLVNIPVKLYSASKPSELDLDMLDKKDHSRIHYKRVNENTGKAVEWKNIVKGYKYKGQYIVLADQDFKRASPEKTSVIDINSFVKESEIESIYFEMPYYLVAEKSGERAYALLYSALTKSEKCGVGSFVLRNKEHLCILRPHENIIVLNTMRFVEEIRAIDELSVPEKSKPKPGELKMAMALIDQLSDSFDPTAFKDTYTAELKKLIRSKATSKGKGKKEKYPQLKVSHRKADDLMSALKASLKKAS